jgi:hypothetical protein
LIAMLGFVNTHVHTSQQLARGIADDVDLLTWLHGRIWPYESHMTEEDSYASTLLCGIELIRSGVSQSSTATSFSVITSTSLVLMPGIRNLGCLIANASVKTMLKSHMDSECCFYTGYLVVQLQLSMARRSVLFMGCRVSGIKA